MVVVVVVWETKGRGGKDMRGDCGKCGVGEVCWREKGRCGVCGMGEDVAREGEEWKGEIWERRKA